MFFMFMTTTFAADINAVRWSNYKDVKTDATGLRIVLDLPIIPKVTSAFKPGSLVVNIAGILPGKNSGTLPIKHNIVQKVVADASGPQSTQISINLDPAITKESLRVFTLRQDLGAGRPDRLVIDVLEKKPVIPSVDLDKINKITDLIVGNFCLILDFVV